MWFRENIQAIWGEICRRLKKKTLAGRGGKRCRARMLTFEKVKFEVTCDIQCTYPETSMKLTRKVKLGEKHLE